MRYAIVALVWLAVGSPALAAEAPGEVDDAVVLSDAQLEGVAAGWGTFNLNISPVIIIQRNTAITFQLAIGSFGTLIQSAATTQGNGSRVLLRIRQR